MKILAQQMLTLKDYAIEQFVIYAQAHLDRALGDNTSFYGEDAVQATIYYGIERAARYGIVGKHDVCLYLELMFSLMGSDFDQDPLYPWTAEILNDPYDPPNDKILLLYVKAKEFLDNVKQAEPRYLENVIACTRNNVFTQITPLAERTAISSAVFAEIAKRFPGKMKYIGENNIEQLISKGAEDAHGYGLSRGSDVAAFILFMFVYGVRFYRDPKYPQAQLTFTSLDLSGSDKIEAMFRETRNFLRRKMRLIRDCEGSDV